MLYRNKFWLAILAMVGLGVASLPLLAGYAQDDSYTFPETGKTVEGRFLEYWQENGGLPQQGFPISEEMPEVSETDGNTYIVQYFERAVFELHPEKERPFDVLLSLLGVFEYQKRYGAEGAPNQRLSTESNAVLFPETGFTVGGRFLEYWQENGGLPQQGYPISNEFEEVSELNGLTYTVQYFERAVFELHPENAPPFDVLLSQLGTFRYREKYEGRIPPAVATRVSDDPLPSPVATGSPRATITPGGTVIPLPSPVQTGTP